MEDVTAYEKLTPMCELNNFILSNSNVDYCLEKL